MNTVNLHSEIEKGMCNGQCFVMGHEAQEQARLTSPVNMAHRLMKGDVVRFVDVDSNFFGMCLNKHATHFTYGCVAIVQRNEREFVYKVFAKDFNKRIIGFDCNGRPNEFPYIPMGQPAEDFRWAENVFEAFKQFEGKVLKICEIKHLSARVLKHGAQPNPDGHFNECDFEMGTRELIHWDYVA